MTASHKGPNRPEFEIQVEDGRGLLLLRPRTFFGWLRVEHFELIIPKVQFPLDITGGIAQFQLKPSQLAGATLSADPVALAELVAVRRAQLYAAGFDDVLLTLRDGHAEVSCRARVGEASATLTARAHFHFADGVLRTSLGEAYTYGYLRRPAPLLAHDLLCVLLNAVPQQEDGDGDPETPTIVGLADVVLRPLDLFLSRVLRPAGWRLLEVAGLRVVATQWGPERAELRYGSSAPLESPSDAHDRTGSATRVAERQMLRSLDVHLLREDLTEAAAAYRRELQLKPEHARLLTERLLSVLVARDAWMREAAEVAREALSRWADFVPGRIALAALALARGRDEEAAEELCQIVDVAEVLADPLVASHAGLTAAECLRRTDPARAIALCENVLARAPGDRRAGELLGELYGELRRWPQLRKLLQAQLRAAVLPRDRAGIQLRLGDLLFSQLADPAAARSELEAAAELDPGEPRIFDLWSRVEAALGHLPAAVSALEKLALLLEQRSDLAGHGAALVRLAQLDESLGRYDSAEAHYQRGLALQGGGDAEVLEKLAAMEARRGRVPEAIAAYERLIGMASDQRRRSAEQELLRLLVGAGRVEDARKILVTMAAEPDAASLRAVAELEESSGHLEEARHLYQRAINAGRGLATAEVELSLARVLRRLGAADQEIATLEHACTAWPGTATAERAARRLLEMSIARNDAPAHARWLDALLAWSPPVVDSHELALQRAELHVRAGDHKLALDLLTDRLDAAHVADAQRMRDGATPFERTICRMLADCAAAVGDHASCAQALQALAADATASAGERALFLCEAVHAQLSAGDLGAGADLAAQAAALAPDDPIVRGALGEVAFRQRRWDEVRSLYQGLLAGAAGGELVEWLRRIGLANEREGRLDEARASYARALEVTDAEGGALVAVYTRVIELDERQGLHAEAARMLAQAARDERTTEAPATRVELLRRAAELFYRRAGNLKDAVALLDEALALLPGDLGCLEALELMAVEQGQPAEVAAVLRRKIAAVSDAERKEEWLGRLGELALSLGRPEEARAAYTQVLEAEPDFRPALRYLAAQAFDTGDHDTAEQHYNRLASVGEREEQRESRLALALIARKAARVEDAELHLWAAIELSGAAGKGPLLTDLESLHEESRDWAKLALVLAHHTGLVATDGERVALELRRARLLLGPLGDPQAALEALHQLMLRAPRDHETLTLVADAARGAGDAPALAEALLSLVSLTPDPIARAGLLVEAAELYRTRMVDPDRAAELMAMLRDIDLGAEACLQLAERVTDPTAANELVARAAAAMSGSARHDALARVVAQARQVRDRPAELAALSALRKEGAANSADLERLAELVLEHDDHDVASEMLLEALRQHRADLSARHEPWDEYGQTLLNQLIAAGRTADRPERIAEALELAASITYDAAATAALQAQLEPVYQQLGAHESLAGIWEQQLQVLDGNARLPLLRRLAALWSDALGDRARAHAYEEEIEALAPPTAPERKINLGALMRSVAPGGPPPEELAELRAHIKSARARLERAASPAEAAAEHMRLAQLFRQAGDLKRARSHVDSVLAALPASRAALATRLELDMAEERWLEAADALDELQRMVDNIDQRADLLYQQGEIRRLKLRDGEAAAAAYLEAIDLQPRHVPTLRRLIDYYWSADDRENLLDVATALDTEGGLLGDDTPIDTRARALVAATLAERPPFVQRIAQAIGPGGALAVTQALTEAARAPSAREAALTKARQKLAQFFPNHFRLS